MTSLAVPGSTSRRTIAVRLRRWGLPFEFRQLNSVIASVNPGKNAYNACVLVSVTAGTGRVTAYASVIDNRSLDPTYIPAQ